MTINKNKITTTSLFTLESIPNELIFIKEILFDGYNFKMTQPTLEVESKDYGACRFKLNNLEILFRTSKITPTKTGQFVTLWKRIEKGPIQPFDNTDCIDLFIISTRNKTLFGQFIFPMSILIEKGIISHQGKEGKRAIRVYPPWDVTTSKQAQKTQKWQLDYFLEVKQDQTIDLNRAKLLFFSEVQKIILQK
jgi:hypothetical protein